VARRGADVKEKRNAGLTYEILLRTQDRKELLEAVPALAG